jgi:hypothetical protein
LLAGAIIVLSLDPSSVRPATGAARPGWYLSFAELVF